MGKMKAIVVSEFGEPDVLAYEKVNIPTIGPEEVLIEVQATSVNFADIKARIGEFHGVEGSSFTPGLDCAGIVIAVGEKVTKVEKGQRVAAFPTGGSYAQYVKAHEALTYPIPDQLDIEVAAASLTVGVTAYNVIKKVARLTEGDTILIHAAAGGIGTTAIQLAKHFGASTIIGTVGSDEKKEITTTLGADYTINYRKKDFVKEVNRLTDGRGVDVILDTISGKNFEGSMNCLADFGRVVIFGHANDGSVPGTLQTDALHSSCRAVMGYSTGTCIKKRPEYLKDAAEAILHLLVEEKLVIHISKSYSLQDASKAHAHIESRNSVGKVVLLPS